MGTVLSLTVTEIASWSEQYLTESTVTSLGKQSLKSVVIAEPLFVKLCFGQVNDMMPLPVNSMWPLGAEKSSIFTWTLSLTPRAPAAPE
jgi:hypothetical protein